MSNTAVSGCITYFCEANLNVDGMFPCFFADAEVEFVMTEYSINEEAGSIGICVNSGVTQGFETDLVVGFMATDGKASE